jgi:hypothetical protein
MKCCNSIKCLDTIGHCGTWTTTFVSDVTGDYDLVYNYGKVEHRIPVSLVATEALSVDASDFPRGMVVFYLQNSSGDYYTDADGNDCFSMDVVISV